MTLRIKGGDQYEPKDSDVVRCDTHGVVTTWGELTPIQQLAVEEGLDAANGLPCLLMNERLGESGNG